MTYDLDKLFIAILKPRKGSHALRWHVGGDIKGIENVSTIVHSDTLFSALCHAWGRLFGKSDIEEVLNLFLSGEPPFRISSIFPMRYTSPQKYFVPKPALSIPKPADQSVFLKYGKQLRDASFIELEALSRWLTLQNDSPPLHPRRCKNFYELVIESNDEYQDSCYFQTEMGIETDRFGLVSPNPFYRGSSIAQRKSDADYAYYFLAYCPDEQYKERLDKLIGEVSRSGIGGERSIGLGRFTAEELSPAPQEWRNLFEQANGSTNYLLLSLCYPTMEEINRLDRQKARYSLITRKGWFDSPTGYQLKRRRCNMFGEGSFLSLYQHELRGQLTDVSPTIWTETLQSDLGDAWHPIYRYGIALGIPIQTGGG